MSTLSQLRKELKLKLSETFGNEANSLTTYLIEDTLGLSLTEQLLHADKVIDDCLSKELLTKALRLTHNEPLQYVCGLAHFGGRCFKVNKHTLIPRPETEQLTQLIKNNESHYDNTLRILDIGTGSGCIAITLSLELNNSIVDAIDISNNALEIATANANTHNTNISFIQCDILNQIPQKTEYDIVVSNPPYICEKEKTDMLPNVLEYEPELALFVPNEDPMLFYRRIAELCNNHRLLTPKGRIYFEINEAYADLVSDVLMQNNFSNITLHHDIYGKPRMIYAIFNGNNNQ